MSYTTTDPEEQLREARDIAIRFHAGKKYGDLPYEVHLDHVVAVLIRFGVTRTDLLAAGFLHDAQEDTLATRGVIEIFTNDVVATLVDAVSDGPGKTRKERKVRPYATIPKVPDAIILKLADRIANLESGHANESSLVAMYHAEQPEFEAALYDTKRIAKGKDPRLARMWQYCRLLAG